MAWNMLVVLGYQDECAEGSKRKSFCNALYHHRKDACYANTLVMQRLEEGSRGTSAGRDEPSVDEASQRI